MGSLRIELTPLRVIETGWKSKKERVKMSAQIPRPGVSNDEQSIRQLVDATLLSLMADDVIFMTPGREPFGKDVFAQNNQAAVLKEATSNIQEIEVLGDSAWMRNYLDLVISTPNEASKRLSGYTLTILKKKPDGRWVISRDANLVMPKQ
jgi:uncharacterized protein (TIGR02246 family)